jgi:uncharacterized protein (DUF924 family)
MSDAQTVLTFWFDELTPPQWFEKNLEMDAETSRRFGAVHERAARGELASWRGTAQGRLAEVIVLDQFSRNMFRDTPGAFAADGLALQRSREAIDAGADQELSEERRMFLYMPFMHSESSEVHEEAVALFEALDNEEALHFEHLHKVIIDRFGRYPHRNEILGRTSTPEELEFLTQPNSSF